MAKGKQKERVEPALPAYSFDACPDDELSSCCPYEYLASSQKIQCAVKRFRAGQRDRLSVAVVPLFPINIAWSLFGDWWPRPYLAISPADRRRHVLSPHGPRNLADLVRPWTHLADAERIIAVYVHPALPLPALGKAVVELIVHDHPELLAKKLSGPEWRIQKRGRGSLIEQYRTDLKALSVWRLQKQFGYRVREAVALMRARRLSTYRDVRAFRRAVRRAAQKIAAIEQELIQFSRGVTA
jgi:hypothetical protein